MPVALILTATERLATDTIFFAIRQVCDGNEYRVVDPIAKIVHHFEGEEDDAADLVRKLVSISLLEHLRGDFRPIDPTDDVSKTFRLAYDRWADVIDAATQVPDPPLTEEAKRLRATARTLREKQAALAERRKRLELELEETRARIGRELEEVRVAAEGVEADLQETELLRSEYASLRDRLAKVLSKAV